MQTPQESLLSEIQLRTNLEKLVGNYVHLVSRGDKLVGACPFHAARSMSFTLEPDLALCHCSECGKAWSSIDLLMEMEKLSYDEALKRLCQLCGINPDAAASPEASAPTPKQSAMFAANSFAARFFHHTLLQTSEGQNIGAAYFHERGISDEMIERFGLGYSPQSRFEFSKQAQQAGFGKETLTETGLSVETPDGLIDRYRGRVIYPVYTISGREVAFGARTLRTDKDVAKYINSPESEIYSKSNELYGMYQARDAIVEQNRCILVEGYMDVISMHQAGICNVVASSGTSLTEGQVAMIKRFTDRITVIYDADAAGIKASVRSIDMLLAADFRMDVVSLPPGEDPDSFARAHTREEIEAYLAENACNFVTFKLNLAKDRIARDPIERSRVISDIVNSISLIPDKQLIRSYVKFTSRMVRLTEKNLQEQVSKRIIDRRMRKSASGNTTVESRHMAVLQPFEQEVIGVVVRNAMMYFCDNVVQSQSENEEEPEEWTPMNVAEYLRSEMELDCISFTTPEYARLFDIIMEMVDRTDEADFSPYAEEAEKHRREIVEAGMAKLRERTDADMQSLQAEERLLNERAEAERDRIYDTLVANHIAKLLLMDPRPALRSLVTGFVRPHEKISRIHTKGSTSVGTERDRIQDVVQHSYNTLKYAIVQCRIADLHEQIREASAKGDIDSVLNYMKERKNLDDIKARLAQITGDMVITPALK